jgi:cold shock CspA family protein
MPIQQRGTILSIRVERNFGFITPEDPARRGEEIFFHKSAVLPAGGWDALVPGDTVTYREDFSKKGARATKVTKVEDPS